MLLWAARAGKPVVAQDYGLVGRLVRDHGLGVVVDTTDHEVLAQTLEWTALTGGEALSTGAARRLSLPGKRPKHSRRSFSKTSSSTRTENCRRKHVFP